MPDITKDDIKADLARLDAVVASLHALLELGTSTQQFLDVLAEVPQLEKLLRAKVIRHSRKVGKGFTAAGKPDRRFSRNRNGVAADLRFS